MPQPLQSASWFEPILAGAEIALRSNSSHALLAAARAGAGVAAVAHFVARHYPELVCVSADLSALPIWLVTHSEYRRDPNVRAAAAFLRALAAEL